MLVVLLTKILSTPTVETSATNHHEVASSSSMNKISQPGMVLATTTPAVPSTSRGPILTTTSGIIPTTSWVCCLYLSIVEVRKIAELLSCDCEVLRASIVSLVSITHTHTHNHRSIQLIVKTLKRLFLHMCRYWFGWSSCVSPDVRLE